MKLIFICSCVLLLTTCRKDSDKVPACIQAKIDQIKNEPVRTPRAQVEEYLYNGIRVFYFHAGCCDQYDEVFDDQCHRVCAPSGGIGGWGDGACPDFKSKAKFIQVAWKDPR